MIPRQEWEKTLSAFTGWPVALATADEPLQEGLLSPPEVQSLEALNHTERRREWLLGRAALRQVMWRLGYETAQAPLDWPHPFLSLSHTEGLTLAIGLAPGHPARGIGIDVERTRPLDPRVGRFFLSERERDCLDKGDSLTLLRLWTVKEALFKADPHNGTRSLRQYELDDVKAMEGTARTPSGLLPFAYKTFAFENGWVTTAMACSVA